MFDILDTIDEWHSGGNSVALATVVSTWGSSPRRAGAKMAALADLRMVGSVSAGCVESSVLNEAVDTLADGKPRLLRYGVVDEQAWEVGLACGGNIDIFVETLNPVWWQIARDHALQERALATITVLTGAQAGEKLAADDDGMIFQSASLAPALVEQMAQMARSGLVQRMSKKTTLGELDVFIDVYRPRSRLVIIGGAHAAIVLAQMAKLLGFQVIIIDPRKAFATTERFPTADLIVHQYPDQALPIVGLTPDTYIALLSHDPKIDDPALRVVLPSSVCYIGVLSSARTHQKRIERLTAVGIDVTLLDRIQTPIGLEIGAKSPEEIALSILAEIVAIRNGVSL
jgi:xanthine dehydrogenase accessory factor